MNTSYNNDAEGSPQTAIKLKRRNGTEHTVYVVLSKDGHTFRVVLDDVSHPIEYGESLESAVRRQQAAMVKRLWPDDEGYQIEETPIRHVMFTNVNGGDENLITCTRLKPEVLANAMRASGTFTFDETYEVPGRDLQYYLADRCTLTEAEERRAEELAAGYQKSGS